MLFISRAARARHLSAVLRRSPNRGTESVLWPDRRHALGVLVAIPSILATACRLPVGGIPAPTARLIDAHCHLFNITDLPASTFIQQVMLGVVPGSPAADELLRWLRRIEQGLSAGVVKADAEAAGAFLTDEPATLSPAEERALAEAQRKAQELVDSLRAHGLVECPEGPSPAPSIFSIVRWLRSFRSSRRRLTQWLTRDNLRSGFTPALLCPALVDYSNWLDQSLTSPLPDQVRAMAAVSANPGLPPVHGYAPFDPLRRALVRTGRTSVDGSWDPLAIARDALTTHGFLGVKIYPPMGFRASGNASAGESQIDRVSAAFGSAAAAAAEIDRSLDELWQLCRDQDAPVMAHAAASNGSRDGYGRRADPSWWLPVARRHPKLRILLAHFGRFRDQAAETGAPDTCPNDEVPFDKTWEAAIGRFVQANPNSLLFADLSYLSELFHKGYRHRAIGRLQQYLQLDPGARHLVFGSDWVMLGIEKGYTKNGGYPARMRRFLVDAGLGPAEIDGVLYGNAMRFLGLGQGGQARSRLERFYTDRGLPVKALPG